ncbi:DUF4251 domain-containing protein [Bacteroidales bacterium OttesenSCG-928-M11]|nr:DUF4251 domain-containing protein [Bacteroidales bacterium OttesenSCG-928-M11]
MKQSITILLIGLFLFSCTSSKMTPEEKKLKQLQVSSMILSKEYTINATQMSPSKGGVVQLTGGHYLRINGEYATAYLPYFGRAHVAPHGEGGIQFEQEKIEDYEVKKTKKEDGWNISFRIDTPDLYGYHFFLTIFDNGNSSFSVSSSKRDPISFYGELETPKINK